MCLGFRRAMLVAAVLLVPVSIAGASQAGWDTLTGGTFGTHATISSGLLEPGAGSAAISFVRTQSGGSTTSGLFQTGYYRANAWSGGDCDRLTVLAYTATFVEWRNTGTASAHCNVSSAGPPGNSLLGEVRTQGGGTVWQAFLSGATNFTPHTLNWGSGFAYGGGEVKNAGQVNQCLGCNPTAWQFATGTGGTGWTTGTQNNSYFFNDGGWSVSLLTGGQFSVFH
jgi:hypothetical protein